MVNLILLFFSVLFYLDTSWSSSCCGQSSSSFTVLTRNETLQVGISQSRLNTEGKIYNNPKEYFVWEEKEKVTDSTQLNISGSLIDRWQWMTMFNLLSSKYKDSQMSQNSTFLSDTLLGVTYEILPEYKYVWWKPIVYGTILMNLPTGHSVFASHNYNEGIGTAGYDQWGVGLGLTILKVWMPWQIKLQMKRLEILDEQIEKNQISQFKDDSVSAFITYFSNFKSFSVTAGWMHSSVTDKVVNDLPIPGSYLTTISVAVSKPIKEDISASVSYFDQSLLGESKNTFINKGITLGLNYSLN